MTNKTTKLGISSLAILTLSLTGVSSVSAQEAVNPLLRTARAMPNPDQPIDPRLRGLPRRPTAPAPAPNDGLTTTTTTTSSSSNIVVENGEIVQREVSGNAGATNSSSRRAADRRREADDRRAAAAQRRAARRAARRR